jgi:SSS family solute:Na+ symporter
VPSSTVVVAISALYLVACLVLGTLPGRKASGTAEGYVAGDRALGLLLMYFITGATIFSAFAFLGAPGWAYSKGAAAFYILGYGALGFVPFYFLGPRAARVGRKYGFVTQAEMVAHRFDSRLIAALMAAISAVAFVPYLALQMKGAGYIINTMTRGEVPEWAGAAIVYTVVLLYVTWSGVLGVGWTNTFQGIFMMLLAWGLGLYLPFRLYGGVQEMFARIAAEKPELLTAPGLTPAGDPWGWGEYSSAVIVSIIGFTMWPHLFMKAFTARDERTLKRTVVLYPTFQIFLVPLFLIGFAGVFFEPAPAQADQILPHMLMNMELPALLVGLFCAGGLAASMSSGDAMAHATASIIVRDGFVRAGAAKLDGPQQRRVIRIMVFVVLVAAYAVAIGYKGSLVFLLLTSYGAVVQFAPGLIATLYSRRATATGVLAGMLSGAVVTGIFVAWPEWRPWAIHAGLYGVLVNVTVLPIVSRLTARPLAQPEAEFLETASKRCS